MKGPRLMVAEPAAAYLQRPKLVVDANVLAAFVYQEPNAADALGWVSGRHLCAPYMVDSEITNTGLNKIRRKTLSNAIVVEAIARYVTLNIERYPIIVESVFELANRYTLSAYDASYLWLAEFVHAPLATFDKRLGEAAREHLGGQTGAV